MILWFIYKIKWYKWYKLKRFEKILRKPEERHNIIKDFKDIEIKITKILNIVRELQSSYKLKKRNEMINVIYMKLGTSLSDIKELSKELSKGKIPSLSMRSLI